MKTGYLLFIVISAFLHAFYNFLMKKNSGDHFFLNGIFVVATLISLPVTLISKGYENIPWHNVVYIYGAAFFYTLYQIFANKSYQRGSISTNYPLTVLSPLFVPIWAFPLLSEKISLLTGLGIFVTVLGAIVVQMKSISLSEFKKIFILSKDHTGAHFALAASLAYSFGAIFDKARINVFPLTAYLSIIIGFMTINMIIHMLVSQRASFAHYMNNNWKVLTIGGIALYLSFLFFRLALQNIEVSVAVPIRQVSIIFAILFGVFFLKEHFGTGKLAATLIIIMGILLINMGLR
jgi:drug/metabolite transporter (DMT)-like permease